MKMQWSNESLEDIKAFKERVKLHLSSNYPNLCKDYYSVFKLIQGIGSEDTDYIPKVVGAGEIFEDPTEPYQLMHNGIKVAKEGYCGPWMRTLIYGLKGHHEPQEEKLFHEILKFMPPKATMIELGSWWGYYSIWFAKQVPEAKVYLIEPDPNSLNLGKKNCALNNVDATHIQGYAINKATCNPELCYDGISEIYIDSFLEQNNINHLNILHSDIQGMEFEMLKSCIRSIQLGKIDYFFISTHNDQVHKSSLQFFKYYNFTIVAEHTIQESYTYDGLIVAKRKGAPGPDQISISKIGKTPVDGINVKSISP